jgi:hypothetical protein
VLQIAAFVGSRGQGGATVDPPTSAAEDDSFRRAVEILIWRAVNRRRPDNQQTGLFDRVTTTVLARLDGEGSLPLGVDALVRELIVARVFQRAYRTAWGPYLESDDAPDVSPENAA